MPRLRPSILLLAFGTACAANGKGGATSETSVSPSTTQLVVGSSSVASMNVGVTNSVTAIASAVSTSRDSTYQLVRRVYAELQIPVSMENGSSRAVGNETLKIPRNLAGMRRQAIVDCGEKMGLPNAETWDIVMNILTYVEANPNGGSTVLTRIQAMGHDPSVSGREQTTCATKGDLEAKIATMVKLKASSK